MSKYVKYIAADGTVHLCHGDSPMLMHAKKNDNVNRVLSMALRTYKTTKNNFKSFCNKNKIKLVSWGSASEVYSMEIPIQDIHGKQNSANIGVLDLKFSFESSPSSDNADSKLAKQVMTKYLNADTISMSNAMREATKDLKKYHLMPGGYYIYNTVYESIKASSTKI